MPWVWRIAGGRTIRAFGRQLRLSYRSEGLEHSGPILPRISQVEDYVSYVDYVQMRAVVQAAMDSDEAPVFVDVGAHHGVYAVLIGKILEEKGGRVLAIEPDSRNLAVLRENVRLNGLERTVVCCDVAISDRSGESGWKSAGGQSGLLSSRTEHGTVSVVTLSDVLKDHGINRISILMIDVEGAELPVLRGAPEWINKTPKIFCEMHPYAWKNFGYTGQEISNFITEIGLRCIDMFFREHDPLREDLFYIGPTMLVRR